MGTINKIITFLAGVTIGSIVAGSIVKHRYEALLYEEQDEPEEIEETGDDCGHKDAVEPSYQNYRKILHEQGYKKVVDEGGDEAMEPRVITGAEYDDLDEYEAVTLTFYDDGVLTDDKNNVITDREHTVGDDFQNHFNEDEYDPDTVYVANDEKKIKYEICMDYSNFADLYR